MQIKVQCPNGQEYMKIEQRSSASLPIFSLGHFRYVVYDESDHILGTFKPARFIIGSRNLNLYNPGGKRVLRVTRKLIGSKWSFFAGKAQVGHLKLKHKSIREYFHNKPDYYFLEILEPAKLDRSITKLIFAVIVICKHGFGVRS